MRNVFASLALLLLGLALQSCTGAESARGQVSLRLSSANGKALSSAGTLLLSPSYCYGLHVTGARIDRWQAATEPSCTNIPRGIGQVESFFSPGQSVTLEVKVGAQRRFDLVAIPKASLPGGDCSSKLRIDTEGASNWSNLKAYANDTLLSVDMRLVATGVADITPSVSNVVELTAQGSDSSGISYGCGSSSSGSVDVALPTEGYATSEVVQYASGTCSGSTLSITYGSHAFGPATTACTSGNFNFGWHLRADQAAGSRSFTITSGSASATRSITYTPRLWTPDNEVKAAISGSGGSSVILGGSFTKFSPFTGGFGSLDAISGQRSGYWDIANNSVYAIISDGLGGYIIGGNFQKVGGLTRVGLARILADGRVDPSWSANLASGTVYALALLGDEIIVGGQFTTLNGQTRTNLGSVNRSTGLTSIWDPAPTNFIKTIAVHADGTRFYVGGMFATISGNPRSNIAAYDSSFALDLSWNPNVDSVVYTAAIDTSNNRLYIGGAFTDVNAAGGRAKIAAVTLNGTGSTDAWYPAGGADNTVFRIVYDESSGLVYAGGAFITIGGALNDYIAAMNNTTGAVQAWDPSANGAVVALAVDTINNRILIGGDFSSFAGSTRNGLAAVARSGQALQAWTNAPAGQPQALLPHGDTVWVGGFFYGLDAVTRNGVAEINFSTGAPTSFDPNLTGGAVMTLLSDATWLYMGGAFTHVAGAARANLARVNLSTAALDTGFISTGAPSSSVTTMALSGSTLYVGGAFATLNGQVRSKLAAIDTSTGVHTIWDPAPNGAVTKITLNGSNVIVTGNFTNIGGQARSRVAEIDSSGLATAYNPNVISTVSTMHLDGTTLFVGGLFTIVNGGTTRNRIAALDAVSAPGTATVFNPNADATVSVMAGDASNLYVGGSFANIAGGAYNGFAILNKTTGAEAGLGVSFSGAPTMLEVIGGKLYVGGQFLNATSTASGFLTRPNFAVVDPNTGQIH